MQSSRAWLCLPPVALAPLVARLTLIGQPTGYWAGDLACRREFNPLGDLLLLWHPAAFLAGIALWCSAVIVFLLLTPPRVAFGAALILTFSHACGAASWIVEFGL